MILRLNAKLFCNLLQSMLDRNAQNSLIANTLSSEKNFEQEIAFFIEIF